MKTEHSPCCDAKINYKDDNYDNLVSVCSKCLKEIRREQPQNTWWGANGGYVIFVIIVSMLIVLTGFVNYWQTNSNEAPNSNGRQYYCDQSSC